MKIKRSKKEQQIQDEYLRKVFNEIKEQQELVAVILPRGTWEEIICSINLALKNK
jgi:hypothetical protein